GLAAATVVRGRGRAGGQGQDGGRGQGGGGDELRTHGDSSSDGADVGAVGGLGGGRVSARPQWVRILPRKSLARGCCGRVKKVSGSVSSRMAPSSMNSTRSPALRAKPISWVTTTMVMPPWANWTM